MTRAAHQPGIQMCPLMLLDRAYVQLNPVPLPLCVGFSTHITRVG